MQLSNIECKLVQRTLNETMQMELKIDGVIGRATKNIIGQYQTKMGLECTSEIDEPTWAMMGSYIEQRFVTPAMVAEAATRAGLQPACLLSLWSVESLGEGFLPSGLCVILFERHVFYKYVKARLGAAQAEQWREKYPDLCHPVWDASFYKGGKAEWDRMGRASALDATCALLATSWGLFQTMGFNYALAGYPDVQGMVAAFQESERNQLDALVKFVVAQPKLYNALRQGDWHAVARIYNGPRYAENKYHIKLANSYDDWVNVQF